MLPCWAPCGRRLSLPSRHVADVTLYRRMKREPVAILLTSPLHRPNMGTLYGEDTRQQAPEIALSVSDSHVTSVLISWEDRSRQDSEDMEVRAVSDRLSDLGEGPFWDVNTQKLYFVDAFVGDVCRLDPATGSTDSIHFDGLVTFVIPYKISPSNVLISYKRSLRKLNFNTGDSEFLTELSEGHPEARFNDAKCDKRGRLWAGTLVENETEKGHLYKLDPEQKLTQVSDGITLSNGIAWSLDNRKMYFIDSVPRKIYVFDYNLEYGTATNKQVLLDYNNKEEYADLGVPDGMTIDIEGKLWVACFGGACVLRIDPETTNILQKVDIPCQNVTSCCFGGPHFDILYVTTAIKFQSDEAKAKYPNAGAVFAVSGLGVRGQPASYYTE